LKIRQIFRFLGRGEREFSVDLGFRTSLTMWAAGAAGLGAGTERLVNDGLYSARAPAAFCAATETAVNLLGIARKRIRGADGTADVMVGEDITGADNHTNSSPSVELLFDI
jgi:hypothetical protein